jgi:hypothetical protein
MLLKPEEKQSTTRRPGHECASSSKLVVVRGYELQQDQRVDHASRVAVMQQRSCSAFSIQSEHQARTAALVCTLAPLLPSSSPCVLVPRAGVVATTRVAVAAVVLRLALPAHPGCAVEPAATGGAVCTVELASRG